MNSLLFSGVETFLLMAGFYLATEKHSNIGLSLGWLAMFLSYLEGYARGMGRLP